MLASVVACSRSEPIFFLLRLGTREKNATSRVLREPGCSGPMILQRIWSHKIMLLVIKKSFPSALQALSKHHPSLLQAPLFSLQARFWSMANTLCFCYFRACESPPKYPYYNIKREKDVKRGAFLISSRSAAAV